MRYRILAMLTLLVMATAEARQVVGVDLCSALVANDRPALKSAIDGYLKTLPSSEPLQSRLETLRRWLLRQPCVASVELLPMLSDTEPPVQTIRILLAGPPPPLHRTIGIVLDPSRLRFDYR